MPRQFPRQLAASLIALAAASGGVQAQATDSAAFIIRLGHDTTAIERYVRTAQQLRAEAVQRSPSTMVHTLTLSFGPNGAVTSGEWTVRAPGQTQPASRRVIRFQGDSAIIENTQAGATRTQRVLAAAAIPMAGPFYSPYELAMMRVAATSAQIDTVPLLPGAAPVGIRVQRAGRDSISLDNQFGEPMRAHVDARGRLLHLQTPALATVERVRWIDLDRVERGFAARDAAGQGMGVLSPRVAARQRLGEANVWLDYSSQPNAAGPSGAHCALGQVWRMGANDAAHFATDRTLQIGNVTVAPGTYTLFLLPNQNEWQLVINRADWHERSSYDQAQDVGRVALNVSTLRARRRVVHTGGVAGQGAVHPWSPRTRARPRYRSLCRTISRPAFAAGGRGRPGRPALSRSFRRTAPSARRIPGTACVAEFPDSRRTHLPQHRHARAAAARRGRCRDRAHAPRGHEPAARRRLGHAQDAKRRSCSTATPPAWSSRATPRRA